MVGFKNRYILIEGFLDPDKDVLGEAILTQFNLSKAIKDSILLNFGEYGLASSLGSFQVKYVNPVTKLSIIRSSREDHRQVLSAMTLVRSIGNCPVILNFLQISGCIRSCKDTALKCDKDKFEQSKLISEEETRQMNNYLEKMKLLEN